MTGGMTAKVASPHPFLWTKNNAAVTEQVPLSRLMGEPIATLRQWAQGRARPATKPEKDAASRREAA